ncbi:uncharacterized protein ATNIH1004_006342 [Aspergillus tanneri]|nr:uncharacterized protein ATNIH1004_006342 [Aspergillus tanneri]KAA8647648.1 hypothetical protein ATNIH1004_006342 [Aspergillus tanneri]
MLQSSHSDKPSDLGELKESSPADQRQYSTIAPNTKYTGRRISQTPTSSSGQTQMQSMTGASAIGHAQTPDQDTMNFLASAGKSPPSSSGDDRPDDVEVFLNPDATLMSTGVASFSSPETLLNLPSPDFESSSNNAPSRQSQPNISSDTQVDETQMIGLGTSGIEKSEHQPGIIIDRTGYMHVMTVEEETERNKQLQQAVMAKMKSVPASPESLNAQNAQPNKNMAKRPCTSDKRPQSVASRLQSSWSSKTGGTLSKWKCRSEVPTNSQSQRPTLFQKIARFFGERRIQERAWAY